MRRQPTKPWIGAICRHRSRCLHGGRCAAVARAGGRDPPVWCSSDCGRGPCHGLLWPNRRRHCRCTGSAARRAGDGPHWRQSVKCAWRLYLLPGLAQADAGQSLPPFHVHHRTASVGRGLVARCYTARLQADEDGRPRLHDNAKLFRDELRRTRRRGRRSVVHRAGYARQRRTGRRCVGRRLQAAGFDVRRFARPRCPTARPACVSASMPTTTRRHLRQAAAAVAEMAS